MSHSQTFTSANKKIALILLLMMQCATSFAQVEKVRAGILYYFIKYTEWPEVKQKGDFRIYVVGEDEIASHLKSLLQGKFHDSQEIRIMTVSSVSEVKDAHIIYLAPHKLSEFERANRLATTSSALLVTSSPGMGAKGSSCNFILKGGKQAYEINEKSLSDCNLNVSSKLIELGQLVAKGS